MKRKLFILSTILIQFSSCSKDSQQQAVPNVSFNFTEYLTLNGFTKLQIPGNWVYVTGGSKGIIIYRKGINYNGTDGSEDFSVLDRNCTYQPLNADAIVSVQSNNIIAIDSSCGSSFYIGTGTRISGPATLPLKAYHYSYDPSSFQLYIYN